MLASAPTVGTSLLATGGARENDGQFHDWREEFYQRLARFACTIPPITRDARVRRGISCHKQRHRLARGKPGQVAHAHLEGIVSKQKAAPYRSGECRD
jgi:ATP-dependent DNA ligase